METKQIIKWIKEFNPHTEHITLSTIFSKMKIDGERFNVINYGPPGTGKSYSSIELINKLNLGNDIIIDNNTTKRGLFDLISLYPDYDFVLDECTEIMKNKGTQDMIKLMMEGKPLTWTKKDSHEVAPIFKGNFILNVNQALMESLTDRCFVNITMMNKKMAMDFTDYFIDVPDKVEREFLTFLKKKLKSESDVKLTKEELDYVKAFIKKQIELAEENLGYSRRIVIRMVSYFKRVKKLFGKLDDEVKIFIEPYAATYIENKNTPTLFETILGDAQMEKIELIRTVTRETGYSERHVRRMIEDELIKGRLQQFGKMVYV